jgi:hypothetical protein
MLAALLNGPAAGAQSVPSAVTPAAVSAGLEPVSAPIATAVQPVDSVAAAMLAAVPAATTTPAGGAVPIIAAGRVATSVAQVVDPVLASLTKAPLTVIEPVIEPVIGPALASVLTAGATTGEVLTAMTAAQAIPSASITAPPLNARVVDRPAAADSLRSEAVGIDSRAAITAPTPLRAPAPAPPADGGTTALGGAAGPSCGSRVLDLAISAISATGMPLVGPRGEFTDYVPSQLAADPSFAPD